MGGSQNKGFEIAVDARHHILRCKLWGVWDLELARNYKHALMQKISEVYGDGEGWCALVDFDALSPSSDEVQRLIRDYLLAAQIQGMQRIVYVGDKQTLRRRFEWIFEEYEHECSAFAESEEQAMQWLL